MSAVVLVLVVGAALVVGLSAAYCVFVVVAVVVGTSLEARDRRRNQAHLLRKDGAR